jgi:hypothetical protein
MSMDIDIKSVREENLAAARNGQAEELIEMLRDHPKRIAQSSIVADCLANGYAPSGYGLADFSILRRADGFHLFHIPRVPTGLSIMRGHEHWIAHAVSRDLDTWETLGPALCVEPANYFESAHVWAPFVCEAGEAIHMWYAGLSDEPSQVLCAADSRDDGLSVWARRPDNPIIPLEGFGWHWRNQAGHVRHARDPHVVQVGEHWLMVYTAMHRNGCPAVGGLLSDDLTGWEDIGAILYRPMGTAAWLPESMNLQALPDGRWALIASQSPGLEYYLSEDPFHWHGAAATPIEYSDGDDEQPVAPEVLAADDAGARWLVAFFENGDNRLFVGVLDRSRTPWTLGRIRSRAELCEWGL